MDFLERDLEDIIFNSTQEQLKERGLFIPKNRKRQFRIGKYGVCDIIAFDKPKYDDEDFFCGHHAKEIYILELKKNEVDINAVIQGFRYAKGVRRYLDKRGKTDYHLNVTIIGKYINLASDFVYLFDAISGYGYSISVLTYKYDVDGLKFTKHSGYYLKDEGF